ncbi:MAG: glutamate racemase [Candidatus Omnitrophica bacterium]|nr:glutamate racemase [Candidatus Omnitrophota bacterium]
MGKSLHSSPARSRRPIGVFDSGLGGLTVVREIRRLLPAEDIVYFGDIARQPYGIKSNEQILRYSIENVLFLLKKKVKAVVIACNSSSSAAFDFLRRNFNLPVVDVIEPAAQCALRMSRSKRIGVIATTSTVASHAYVKILKRESPSARVFQTACPLFVPLVEEGWREKKITEAIVRHYLSPMKKNRLETLILGCTHYPLIKNAICRVLGRSVRVIDSAKPTAEKLASLLLEKGLLYAAERRGRLKIYVSDLSRNFVKVGERFLGEKLRDLEIVRLK